MLAARYRFHGHGSLRYVLRRGASFRNRLLTLRVSKNPRRTHSRVAVVISKKVHKSAVRRNRVRRRVYEILRHSLDRSVGAHDVVIIVTSPEVIDAPHTTLNRSILELLLQAGLCKTDDQSAIINSQ